MADPQLEKGYTKIANELLDKIASFQFNGTQRSILDCIIRYTYGFNRKTHKLSLSFIVEYTKYTKNHVQRELKKLIDNKVILIDETPKFNATRKMGINKNYDEWLSTNILTVNEKVDSTLLMADTVNEKVVKTVNEKVDQEIKKKNKKESLDDFFTKSPSSPKKSFNDKMDEFLKENDLEDFNVKDM